MAVLLIQRMPPMFTTDQYDALNKRMGDEMPDGMISHTVAISGDEAVMATVWESQEKFEAFREGQLNPALKELVGSEAFEQMPTPERDFYEVHDHQHS
jgi:heme-degrading monooxygenase HmoA